MTPNQIKRIVPETVRIGWASAPVVMDDGDGDGTVDRDERKVLVALGGTRQTPQGIPREANALLWFATRGGKPVSNETVAHIVAAQSVLSEKRRDPEIEGQFWAAFRDLANQNRCRSIRFWRPIATRLAATAGPASTRPAGAHGGAAPGGRRGLVDWLVLSARGAGG
jgi:hypothetical protein